jgi:peroxiredoxin
MKKLCFLTILTPAFFVGGMLLPSFSLGQGFVIKGKIGTYNAPAKVYLDYTDHVDSAAVINGSFEFIGTVTEPVKVTLSLNRDGDGYDPYAYDKTEFYIDKGNTAVNSPDSAINAVVTGTEVAIDYTTLKKALNTLKSESDAIKDRYYDVDPQQQEAPAFKREMDSLQQLATSHYNGVIEHFIHDHPGSYISLVALQGYTADYSTLAGLYLNLSDEVKNTVSGMRYGHLLSRLKQTQIGQLAPNFTQTDTSGRKISLASFQGKYVLLDFWASWCGPCRKENPNVVKLYNRYKDKGFTVIGISLDKETARNEWLQAIRKDGLTWTQLSDLKYFDNAVAKLYSIESIPRNFLIDPQGKIIARDLRGEELAGKLATLLNK